MPQLSSGSEYFADMLNLLREAEELRRRADAASS